MKLTTLISKLQTELSIYSDELYLTSFINALRAERASGIIYPELVREVTLNFASTTTNKLPNDFLFYVLPTFASETKPFFVVDSLAYQVKAPECVVGKIVVDANGDAYAVVKENVPEPLVFTYLTKHLYRFKTWQANDSMQTDEYVFYDFRYYKALNAGSLGTVPPTHTSGTAVNGTVNLQYDERIFDFYDINLLPQIELLYPEEICELLVAIYIKRKRGLDYSYEEQQYYAARSAYGGRTNRQTTIDLTGTIAGTRRIKPFTFVP